MKKENPEKVELAFNNLARAAFNAGLTFKAFLEVIEMLEEEAIRGSVAGETLRVQLLNET